MIGVCLLVFVSGSLAAITKPPPTDGTSPTQAPITINPKLRKALLEALSNYDGDDSTEAIDEETSTVSSTTEDYDEVTDIPTFVKIHTFSIDGDKSDENELIKTIIISRPRTTLTPPKERVTNSIDDEVEIKFGKSPDPVNNDNESDKTENIQILRSVEGKNSNNVEKKEEKTKKKASEKSVTKPITPIPTTTTLAPPVTNADGENIERAEEVKIQQAPLLAAFTVQQDINGQPNKVISLFKNQQSQVNDKRIVNMQFKASQPIPSPTAAPVTAAPTTTSSNQQLLSAFELKQRQLEEQIRFLQVRQREQDEIIRRHQLLQDQQNRQQQQRNRFEEEQRQRQRFDEEQRQRQRFDQEQAFLLRQQQEQSQQPQTQALIAPPSPSNNVQFIQSIPVGHTVGISVEQQLPFKGPGEFNPDKPDLQKSFQQLQQNFQFRQFQQQQQRNAAFNQQQQQQQPIAQALIQKQEVQQLPTTFTQLQTNLELPVRNPQNFIQFTPLPINLELPQKPFQTFNSAPLSVLPSITEIAPQGQGRTRVFRQDASQTGNFGFNDNRNFQFQQQQIDPVQSALDNQLQNLFHQSGINTRSTEDFGIISKVLALNHGIPNEYLFSNRQRF